MNWFRKELCGLELAVTIIFSVFLKLSISLTIALLMVYMGIELESVGDRSLKITSFSFPFILFVVVFVEEFVFRFTPIVLSINSGAGSSELFLVIVLSSAFFGFLHGDVKNILIQGSGGIILSILFLKAGGLNRNYKKAFWSVVVCHYMFNATILLIMVMSGNEYF